MKYSKCCQRHRNQETGKVLLERFKTVIYLFYLFLRFIHCCSGENPIKQMMSCTSDRPKASSFLHTCKQQRGVFQKLWLGFFFFSTHIEMRFSIRRCMGAANFQPFTFDPTRYFLSTLDWAKKKTQNNSSNFTCSTSENVPSSSSPAPLSLPSTTHHCLRPPAAARSMPSLLLLLSVRASHQASPLRTQPGPLLGDAPPQSLPPTHTHTQWRREEGRGGLGVRVFAHTRVCLFLGSYH